MYQTQLILIESKTKENHGDLVTGHSLLLPKINTFKYICGFPSGSGIKNLSAMQETWVRSLVWKDPLEKEMATQSSALAWKIPWTEEPGRIQSMGSQKELDTT